MLMHKVRGAVPKWLRGRSAKPLFAGSIPAGASIFYCFKGEV